MFFISKSPGGCAIYCRNARVLEMQNFTPAYRKWWTYVRTIFSEPKFLGCIIYQIFLPVGFRCARESSAINNNLTRQKANFCFCTRPILYRMRTRSLLKQTANCPLILIHGPHWLHWDDPNLRSTVHMKTVFLLNALFFPHKIKDVQF